MNLLKNVIQQIKDFFINDHSETNNVNMQRIINSLGRHFEEVTNKMSTKETLAFPMTFTIYLHPADYERISPYFQGFRKEIIKSFYRIICENHKKGRAITDYHAHSWNIYLTQANFVELGDKSFTIQEGEMKIWSSAFDIIDDKRANKNISFTIDDKGTIMNYNIDQDTLDKLHTTHAGHIQEKWVNPLQESAPSAPITTPPSEGRSASKNNARGELTCKTGTEQRTFLIRTDSCKISGEKDTREDPSIFKINSPNVETQHAEIRYDSQTQEFKLAAYRPTTVNYLPVPISTGGDVKWTPLPDGAKIILANSVIIEFKKLA